MKKIILMGSLVVWLLGGLALASEVTDAGIGARSMGIGGAHTALADDAFNAVYGNPAALAGRGTAEITSMYSNLTGDLDYSLLGIAFPHHFGDLAIGYGGNRTYGITTTTLDANSRVIPLGTMGYFNDMFVLGYGRKLMERLAFGLKLKYYSSGTESVASGTGTGLNADMGFLYNINKNVDLGLQLTNIIRGQTGAMKWGNGTNETMPWAFNLGLAFKRDTLKILIDYCQTRSAPTKLELGLEYFIRRNLALRGGLANVSLANGQRYANYTAGLGFWVGNMKIDYAYEDNGLLAYNSRHYVSFSLLLPNLQRRERGARKPAAVAEVGVVETVEEVEIEVLPRTMSNMEEATVGNRVFHYISVGDTLAKISKTYYGTYQAYPNLAEINKLASPNLIVPGHWLKIPYVIDGYVILKSKKKNF